jgi:hypothetical protein
VLLQLGFTTATTINGDFAGYPANLWWPWALAGAVVVLAVFLIVHVGGHNAIKVFGSGYTPSGFKGMTGVVAGSVYTVLAFGGFEGAVPLAEEATDPKRNVQKAVLFPTLGIGVLYVFTTYAARTSPLAPRGSLASLARGMHPGRAWRGTCTACSGSSSSWRSSIPRSSAS